MALFGKKRPKVVDWTERLQKQREQTENIRSEMDSENPSYRSMNPSESSVTPFPFFAGNTSETSGSNENSEYNPYGSNQKSNYNSNSEGSDIEEKRRRLGKRLLDMTNKIEDLTNQIYRLQQRIEVLERKSERTY